MLAYTLSIAAIGLAGGVLPLLGRRSERLLHLFIPFAAGIFLGVVFLHMLPEVAHMAATMDDSAAQEGEAHAAEPEQEHEHPDEAGDEHEHPDEAGDEHEHPDEAGDEHEHPDEAGAGHAEDHEHGDGPSHHQHGGTPLWTFVMIGVVGLYLLENLVFRSADSARHQHVTLGYASLLGLSVHAFTAGLGLAGAATRADLAWPVYCSIVSHKLTETFSLATVFMLAGLGVRRVLLIVALFSLVTPAGVLIGQLWVEDLNTYGIHVLVSLAAGTFLFVAVCDLLPEVFHHRQDALAKVGLLIVGILATYVIHEAGG